MHISNRLMTILNTNDTLSDLVYYANDISDPRGDYFDVSGENISYIPNGKEFVGDPYEVRGRVTVRPGRWFNRLRNLNDWRFNIYDDAEIERLVAHFEAWSKPIDGQSSVQLVSGEDIRFWYHEKNYAKDRGGLRQSCMRYTKAQPLFDLFVQNPDHVQMLIATNDENKLIARSMIFTDVNGNRVSNGLYYGTTSGLILLGRWCQENNIHVLNRFGDEGEIACVVRLPNWDTDTWPSMDMLSYTDNQGTWSNRRTQPTMNSHFVGWRRNGPNGGKYNYLNDF